MDSPPAELRWAHPAAAVALLLLSGSLIWWCYGSASPPGWLPAVGGASLILALVLISTVSSRRRTRVFLALWLLIISCALSLVAALTVYRAREYCVTTFHTFNEIAVGLEYNAFTDVVTCVNRSDPQGPTSTVRSWTVLQGKTP